MDTLIGKTINNRYHVRKLLGRGGMAEVYQVWDQEMAVTLAMKLLHDDIAMDKIFMRRFKREAETLAKLQHPHIVRFYGLKQEGSQVFMLMDCINGPSFKKLIYEARGPMSLRRVLELIRPVCSALHYAHLRGYVHADIKPANILMNDYGQVFLSDFGIARMTDAATATMVGAGTPAYMSPEQVKGLDPTPLSDIYSLGIMIFEMLTGGERPFVGDRATVSGSVGEKIRWEQIHQAAPKPSKYNREISKELDEIIAKCLEKEPSERWQTPIELLNSLEMALGKVNIETPEENKQDNANVVQQVKSNTLNSSESPNVEKKVNFVLEKIERLLNNNFEKQNDRFVVRFRLFIFLVIVIMGLIIIFQYFGDHILKKENNKSGNLQLTSELMVQTTTSIPNKTATFEKKETIFTTETKTLGKTTATSEIFVNQISKKDNIPMVFIPAGSFLMGSESNEAEKDEYPQHKVYLDAYWIDQYEVTNKQFEEFVRQTGYTTAAEKNGCSYLSEGDCVKGVNWKNPFGDNTILNNNEPVVHVNWYDAMAYCEWADRRLPTEAEWEKAARGEEGQRFPWGDNWVEDQFANFCDKNCQINSRVSTIDDGYPTLAPVGSFPNGASPYGVMDMAGNVLEWVFDFYGESYYSSSIEWFNPSGPESGQFRGIRGGAWAMEAKYMRSSFRGAVLPQLSNNRRGFRCVMDSNS